MFAKGMAYFILKENVLFQPVIFLSNTDTRQLDSEEYKILLKPVI